MKGGKNLNTDDLTEIYEKIKKEIDQFGLKFRKIKLDFVILFVLIALSFLFIFILYIFTQNSLILSISIIIFILFMIFILIYSKKSPENKDFLPLLKQKEIIDNRILEDFKDKLYNFESYYKEETKNLLNIYMNKLKRLKEHYRKDKQKTDDKNKDFRINLDKKYMLSLKILKKGFERKFDNQKKKNLELTNAYFVIQEYREVLSFYQLNLTKSIEIKILSSLEKKNITLNKSTIKENIEKMVSSEFSNIPVELLKLFYSSSFDLSEGAGLWKLVKKRKNLKDKLISIIVKKLDFEDIKSARDKIQLILQHTKTFKIESIIKKIKILNWYESIHDVITPFMEIFKVPDFYHKISIEIIKNDILQEDIEEILDCILNVIITNLSKGSTLKNRMNLPFKEISKYLMLKEFFSETFTIIYLKQCKNISNDKSQSKQLWKLLNSYSDYRDFITEFIQQPTPLIEFLETKIPDMEIKKNKAIIKIFKDMLSKGRIIIEKERLFAEHMRDAESKYSELDYLFKKLGDIDYQYLNRAVLNKNITYENLSNILIYKMDFIPFLITYESGITKIVDEILGISKKTPKAFDIGKDKQIIASKYTPQARIGIITKGFKKIQDFRAFVHKEFNAKYFVSLEKKENIISEEDESKEGKKDPLTLLKYNMELAIIEKMTYIKSVSSKRLLDEKEILTEMENLKNSAFKAFKKEEIHSKELLEFKRICRHSGAQGLIDQVLNAKSILIHPLFPEKLSIQSIEIVEKYSSILDRLKQIYLKNFENKTVSAGIVYGKKTGLISFLDIFKIFLETGTFEDLLFNNPIFLKFKENYIDKYFKRTRDSISGFILNIFGEKGRNSFLKSLEKVILLANLSEFGDYFIDDLKLNLSWNPLLIEKNQENLKGKLGKIILTLQEFWLNQFKERFKGKEFFNKEEIKKLDNSLFKLSRIVIYYILYVKLVILNIFDLKEPEDYTKNYDVIRNYLNSHFGKRLREKWEDHHIFKKFLYHTIKLLHTLKFHPINLDYSIAAYKSLEDGDVERIFQNLVFAFYKPYFKAEMFREVEFIRAKIDFQIHEFPLELKVKKSTNKKNFTAFIQDHISQISDYCCKLESDIGCLMIYDNTKAVKVNPKISDCIKIVNGVVSQEFKDHPIKPKIIVIRVPNYLEHSSRLSNTL